MSWRQHIRFWFRRVTTQDIDAALSQAKSTESWRHVLWLCNQYLKRDPQGVPVVLVRARCFQALGHKDLHDAEVSLAYRLDDTFVPAIYQQAALWVEQRQTEQALQVLAHIKDHVVVKDGVNTLLGTLCSRRARADLASEYQLRAWMANFDNIRYANSFLFSLTYVDIEELLVASEHKFWAETLLPYQAPTGKDRESHLIQAKKKIGASGDEIRLNSSHQKSRLKIGYWGGDFKEHSVRYFFRPLLEGHSHEAVEVYIYDDNFMDGKPDEQTAAIRSHADLFFSTSDLTDDEVVALIQSHNLDVLVDLQGHTSANRLHLWQVQLAKIQMTGLAYPPTTGLSQIGYKFVDVNMFGPGTERFYTERQLVFPESFWCFDPKEDAPYNSVPPYHRAGHVSLGCWGNAAKISQTLLGAWAQILKQAPSVRLQVVSHTFGDEATEQSFQEQMEEAGLPLDRVSCRPAYSLDELWLRYQEVDLMLDTFPFNGGTTSSWSLYAGVPVLTLAGQSLQSRMGRSMMTNLGFPEFVVESMDEYVAKALELIQQPAPLDAFRAVARQRFKLTSLGNGERFAQHFEYLCRQALAEDETGHQSAIVPNPNVPNLPLDEMLRRARMVRYHGQLNAFDRIISLARHAYGQDPRVLDFELEGLVARGRLDEVIDRCSALSTPTAYTLHALALASILQNKGSEAIAQVRRFIAGDLPNSENSFGGETSYRQQQALWAAWLQMHDGNSNLEGKKSIHLRQTPPSAPTKRWLILVVGRDSTACEKRTVQLRKSFDANGISVEVQTCNYWDRVETVNELLQAEKPQHELVLLIRDHVEFEGTEVLACLEQTMTNASIVSPAGALRWTQKEWAQDLPAYKYWGLMRPSLIKDDWLELHLAGDGCGEVVLGAQVLDGQMLAFKLDRVRHELLDETLDEAGYWAEEEWSHRLAQSGVKMVIHRGLGVVIHPSMEAKSLHTSAGLRNLLHRLNVDPLALPIEHFDVQSIHVRSVNEGLGVLSSYLNRSIDIGHHDFS